MIMGWQRGGENANLLKKSVVYDLTSTENYINNFHFPSGIKTTGLALGIRRK